VKRKARRVAGAKKKSFPCRWRWKEKRRVAIERATRDTSHCSDDPKDDVKAVKPPHPGRRIAEGLTPKVRGKRERTARQADGRLRGGATWEARKGDVDVRVEAGGRLEEKPCGKSLRQGAGPSRLGRRVLKNADDERSI